MRFGAARGAGETFSTSWKIAANLFHSVEKPARMGA